jgi:hypothetical protein
VTPLPAADMEILAFERTQWKYLGAKETAVRERFGHSLTRYFQRLNAIIDQPAAEVYDPETVRRLRRLREHRAAVAGRRAVGGTW